jgi:hypothetical protein
MTATGRPAATRAARRYVLTTATASGNRGARSGMDHLPGVNRPGQGVVDGLGVFRLERLGDDRSTRPVTLKFGVGDVAGASGGGNALGAALEVGSDTLRTQHVEEALIAKLDPDGRCHVTSSGNSDA